MSGCAVCASDGINLVLQFGGAFMIVSNTHKAVFAELGGQFSVIG